VISEINLKKFGVCWRGDFTKGPVFFAIQNDGEIGFASHAYEQPFETNPLKQTL